MDLLFTVTDSQLLATKYVTLIFMGLLILGTLINIRQLVKTELQGTRIRKLIFIVIMASLLYPVYGMYNVESSLLASDKYVPGTTIGFCEVFALGKGVEFEYTIDGVTYTNCDTYHPISRDSITVPNGKYEVRYAKSYPEQGRIDLSRPIIKEGGDESIADNLLRSFTRPRPNE